MAKQFEAELVIADAESDGRTAGEMVIPLNLTQSVKVFEAIAFEKPLRIRFIRTTVKTGIAGPAPSRDGLELTP